MEMEQYLDLICCYNGVMEENEGRWIYKGGSQKMRNFSTNTSFFDFVRILEGVSQIELDKMRISFKNAVSGYACAIDDEVDYSAMLNKHRRSPEQPIIIWILKHARESTSLPQSVHLTPSPTQSTDAGVYVPIFEVGVEYGTQPTDVGRGTEVDPLITSSLNGEHGDNQCVRDGTDAMEVGQGIEADVDVQSSDDDNDRPVDGAEDEDDALTTSSDVIECAPYNETPLTGDKSFFVGQRHNNKQSLERDLRTYAVENHFNLKHRASSPDRIIKACLGKDCTWRIYCTRLEGTPIFTVRSYRNEHTCGLNMKASGNLQASSKWVAEIITNKLRENSSLSPKDIRTEMQQQYGVDISYKVAWVARENCLRKIRGNFSESYQLLTSYCAELKKSDPDAFTDILTVGNEERFQRFYWTFGPTVRSYRRTLRPIVLIDGTHLNGRYGGILLSAIAIDGNSSVFPLAFAIVEYENNESWSWFLKHFGDTVVGFENPFLLQSDRHPGILYAVPRVLPNAIHAYCAHHISQNLPGGDENIKEKFQAAAEALTEYQYERIMRSISTVSIAAYDYIVAIGKEHWASAFIPGRRYGVLYTTHVESWNRMILVGRELPVTSLVEAIRANCSEHFNTHREKGDKMKSRLTPWAESHIFRQREAGRLFTSIPASMTLFQVQSPMSLDMVDLEKRTCTCNWFQTMGIPCEHAMKCINDRSLDVYEFCEKYYMAKNFRETYKEIWVPTRGKEQWLIDENDKRVAPPKEKVMPGRPRRVRKHSKRRVRVQRNVCSKCKVRGHNSKTCGRQQTDEV